jgi:pyridoxine 5-phosphate synthase
MMLVSMLTCAARGMIFDRKPARTIPMNRLRLGVNIDHVATVRNARGAAYPDPVRAAKIAEIAGADGITAHLREDRRHISDADIDRLSRELRIPLNLEMAATDEMLAIALRAKPHAACIVPEKREERTTEGGIDAAGQHNRLAPLVRQLGAARVRVSMFIEPDKTQLEASRALGAPVVELHTGAYAEAGFAGNAQEQARLLEKIRDAAAYGTSIGLEIHAGHGLTYDNVKPIAAIADVRELNIGHFLIGEAIFSGLDASIRRMRALMDEARAKADGRNTA